MPTAHILLESPIERSFRVEQVLGMFDVPSTDTIRHEWDVDLPLDESGSPPWQIGLIVGPSGSGKTTIGSRLFPNALFHTGYRWPKTASVLDGFPKRLEGKEIVQALSSVGFSSPPHWVKRYAHLSNGQKFRCELARLMLEDAAVVVFDEFTSVVDRDAAKVSSFAVAKALRARGKPKLVALSCHYDVLDWLDPDWVYDVGATAFQRRSLRRRPPIELVVRKVGVEAWRLFCGHHYLSRSLHKSARCYVALWDGTPVAFTSFVHSPHPLVRDIKREHRTVVLPDYQGVGIGNALSEWLGRHLKTKGWRFTSSTSHPAMIRHRLKHRDKWKCCSFGHQDAHRGTGAAATSSISRLTARFMYCGPAEEPPPAASTEIAPPGTAAAEAGGSDCAAPSTTAPRPRSPRKPRRAADS